MKKKFPAKPHDPSCMLLAPLCFFAGWIMLSGFPYIAHAQRDSVTPLKNISTGHSYVGIEGGITGSEYLGERNFLWGILTVFNTTYNAPQIATYLPFSNLGNGIGFVGGAKVGIALSRDFDLEAKFRFLTNYTSGQDSRSGILLDPKVPTAMTSGTSTYSLLLSSVDAALLAHARISDYYYAAGGFSFSQLVKNGFSASQHVNGDYVDNINGSRPTLSDQQQPEEQISNWFFGTRADAQIGIGAVTRFSSTSTMLLDAELLVGIPFTQWLTKVADSSLNATAKYWLQPAITDPHLWYVTLTIGLRLPFEKQPTVPVALNTGASNPTRSDVIITERPPIAGKHSEIQLSGKVTDAATGKPLTATLTAVDLSNNKVVGTVHTDSKGNYKVNVAGPGEYSVTANANGHLFGTALFEVDSEGRILTSQPNIALSSSGSGGKTRLLVFFEFDKADLQPASSPELNRAVELMNAVPAMKVEIAGYSDTIGTLPHNMDLSLRRANAVRDFLVQHGIAPDRITAHGYGPASPIATNATDEGRAENRRVEFVVRGE